MSRPYSPGALPQPEHRPDNTLGWIAINALVWTAAAPFFTAYWAREGLHAIKKARHEMRPSSGPFRDYRRLQYEQMREQKLGIPASNEVRLPMRLDNERPAESPRPAMGSPMGMPARFGNPSAAASDFRRTAAPRGATDVVLSRFQEARVDLRVPFADRDEAKSHGARWDGDNKTWYAPGGTDLQGVTKWLPSNVTVAVAPDEKRETVVPEKIETARPLKQAAFDLDEMVLVGAMASDDSEVPPIDAYDDVPF